MNYELEVVQIRLVKEAPWYSDSPVTNCDDVAKLMIKEFGDYDREVFCILNLATDGKVINANVVSIGTINATLISPREIFKSSILSNAATIIAVHNHPSGDVSPSREDKLTTQKLREAGELLNIELLDHLIIGSKTGKYFSFRTENMLGIDYRRHFQNEFAENYR